MLEQDIRILHQLLQEGKCCSSCLAEMGLRSLGRENPELVQAASGLCLGLRTGLTCGALTGGALALSLYDPQLAADEMIPRLAEWFQETMTDRYGGIDCRTILAEDPANKPLRCPALVEEVWKKVRELLEDEGYEVTSLFE